LVVGVAYLIQGLIGSVGVLMLGRLAQLGAPLEDQVGILASGAIPWVLKFAVALLLDLGPSWPLRIRGLVLAGLHACAAVCVGALALAWVDVGADSPISVLTIGVGWVALNVCAAAQDVIVDALALDTLGGRRAAAATAMGVGMGLGFGLLGPLVVGGRIVSVDMAAGLRLPAWWIAGLALVPALVLWQPGRPSKAREQPASREREPGDWLLLLWILALFVALMFAANLTQAVSYEFLFQELRWDYPRYASKLLPIGAVAGIVGALACGPLVARLGPARAAMLGSTALGLGWLCFAGLEPRWSIHAVIMGLAAWEGLLQSALLVGLHALALLAAARSPMPTTAFVLAMAALNLPRVLAPLLAVQAVAIGWVGLFAACGLLQVLAGAGLWPLVLADLEARFQGAR
jgi:uncharacterized integral membrane protein